MSIVSDFSSALKIKDPLERAKRLHELLHRVPEFKGEVAVARAQAIYETCFTVGAGTPRRRMLQSEVAAELGVSKGLITQELPKAPGYDPTQRHSPAEPVQRAPRAPKAGGSTAKPQAAPRRGNRRGKR